MFAMFARRSFTTASRVLSAPAPAHAPAPRPAIPHAYAHPAEVPVLFTVALLAGGAVGVVLVNIVDGVERRVDNFKKGIIAEAVSLIVTPAFLTLTLPQDAHQHANIKSLNERLAALERDVSGRKM